MLSVLCDARTVLSDVCSRMSRSRGVSGMSGSEVRWLTTSTVGRCSVFELGPPVLWPAAVPLTPVPGPPPPPVPIAFRSESFSFARFTRLLTAFSTSSTTSFTFSLLSDGQSSPSFVSSTSSHSFSRLPSETCTWFVALMNAELCSFTVGVLVTELPPLLLLLLLFELRPLETGVDVSPMLLLPVLVAGVQLPPLSYPARVV
uniref:Uncharacterized protein n=1 Tax=Anopheles coluzzii TaxID=1518534 RepID=A0A8W7PMY1_ANOCL